MRKVKKKISLILTTFMVVSMATLFLVSYIYEGSFLIGSMKMIGYQKE